MDFSKFTEPVLTTRSPHVSEQILQITEVVAKGTEVFADQENFLKWIQQPNKAFAQQTPMNLLKSRFGTDMIIDELGRIEYGIFS